MEFTGMHDLSIEYILQDVAKRQQREMEWIGNLSSLLETDATARALAQESLGAAKAHLQSLEECISTPAG